MSFAKVVLAIAWVLCIASFFVATDSRASGIGKSTFVILSGIHLLECGFFLRRLRDAPGSLAHHLVQTFFFGFIHISEVRQETGAAGPNT
ncbi:MAG: hypothetical protein ACE5FL_01075 [Myxococcota bacterium]